jgi:uncharacterized protein involved in type VI secretion and phage assembly
MIGFEFGDPNRPFVMGSMFHGKNSQGGGTKNSVKSIITRSGIKIVFDDSQKSLHIEDPSGNTWDMDGKGNIDVNAPKNISITAGKDILVNAGGSITVDAGQNISESAGENIVQAASGDIVETADNKTEIVSENYQRVSEKSTVQAESVTAFSSDENMVLQSGKTVKLNSAEKMNMF